MTAEELRESLRIEPAPEGYCAVGFDCGEEDLTAYICDGTSAGDELAGVSRSYLVFRENDHDTLVGYFTVLADSIHLETKERPKELAYPNAPAIKLGRMAVASDFRGNGLGRWILDVVVGLALDMSAKVGVRYVTVDALPRERLVAMYEDYGFKRNKSERKREKLLRKKDPPYVSMRYDIRL